MNRFIVLFLVLLLSIIGCTNDIKESDDKQGIEVQIDIPANLACNVDSECVPEQCCHPTSCVNLNYKNTDCAMKACTMECKPATLDCGQGSCVCEDHKCLANI